MSGTLRRVRAYAGQLGLLAALVMLGVFVASGPPRVANDRTDAGLRADLGALGYSARDLTFSRAPGSFEVEPGGDRAGELDQIRDGLPAPLPALIGDSWYAAEVGPAAATRNGGKLSACPPLAAVRRQTGADEATRMVGGRRPASSGATTEAVVGVAESTALGWRIGDRITVHERFGTAEVRIVGVFEPVDAAAPIWDDMRLARVACPSPDDDATFRVTLLTDPAGARIAGAGAELIHRWRYRLDERRITADRIGDLTVAVAAARRQPPTRTNLLSSVDTTLADFDRRLRGVRAVLAVIQAGILATVAGLILLAARLAVDRRRAEYALIRARGGAVRTVAARAAGESLLVAVPAGAAGWLAGAVTGGRADRTEPLLVLGVLLLGALAPVAYAAAGARRPDFTGHRRDLVTDRPTPRRITAEVFVVALAAGGAFLVRRRGLATGSTTGSGGGGGVGVDPYLVAVPVLLALAASLLALRLMPLPLRWAGRLAGRARGAVAFLGLSGAGRGAPLRSGPLAVLVVAIATGIFSSTVTTTIAHARDRTADLAVPADALVTGFSFAPGTERGIAAVPGVTRATPVLLESAAAVRSAASPMIVQAQAMVVDARTPGLGLPAALTRAVPTPAASDPAPSGRRLSGPAASRPAASGPAASGRAAGAGSGQVPVLVSPRLARRVGDAGQVDVQGRRYRFRVAAVAENAPVLGTGLRDFLVLPQQAMAIPDFQPIVPNRILVSGARFDPAAIRAAADAGQRQQALDAIGQAAQDRDLPMPATVTTRSAYRAGLDGRGVDGVLSFTFAAGIGAAAGLALLAVALTVLAGAPARGRTLSRLRTMGLSAGQGRRLLIYELVPSLGVAVLVGGLVGLALPVLIGPALGLDAISSGEFGAAGTPARLSVDPLLAAVVLVIAVLAVAAALVVEDVANRRLRLGTVLRLGEEQP